MLPHVAVAVVGGTQTLRSVATAHGTPISFTKHPKITHVSREGLDKLWLFLSRVQGVIIPSSASAVSVIADMHG